MPNINPPQGAQEPARGLKVVSAQNPMPMAAAIGPVGRWMAYHARWQANIDIQPDNTFKTTNQGAGKWSFDGKILTLKWASNRPPEALTLQPDGTFYRMCPEGSFVLRKC
jgi:hypothetical protein